METRTVKRHELCLAVDKTLLFLARSLLNKLGVEMRGMAIKQREQRSTSRSVNKSDISYLKTSRAFEHSNPLEDIML